MISAIALDGSPSVFMTLLQYCSRLQNIELKKTFSEPDAALKYVRKFPVDITFLDFQIEGLDKRQFIQSLPENVSVIGMSATAKEAIEGYELQVLDFLLKPFSFERFQKAVMKASGSHTASDTQESAADKSLYLRADYSLKKINIKDILYIEALDDYLKVHLKNQKTVVAKMTMKSMQEKLNSNEFIRVHRSFIVPVKGITQIRKKVISIDGIKIPIGHSYEGEVKKVISQKT